MFCASMTNKGMLSRGSGLSTARHRFVTHRVDLQLRTKQRTHLSWDQCFKGTESDTDSIPFQQKSVVVLECVSIQEVAS